MNGRGQLGGADEGESEGVRDVSFEASLQRLETIVRQLEEGALGLTDSLARYEEGLRCLQQCHVLLQQAERKVELMTGVAADGTPIAQEFDEGELSLEEKAAARSKRRSRGDSKADSKTDSKADGKADGKADAKQVLKTERKGGEESDFQDGDAGDGGSSPTGSSSSIRRLF